MREINIAQVLVRMRREKGITQEELASFIGVTKASVSKWETGQSYPDVTFLPQLAAFFNISIDRLMDYHPQLTHADIRKLYLSLSADFATKTPAAVFNRCRQALRKYYSCYPLLLQIGILYVNHTELAGSPENQQSLLSEAKALFQRIRLESDDLTLAQQARYLEALCELNQGNSGVVLDLLGEAVQPKLPPEPLIAAALQGKGRTADATAVLQAGAYQGMVILFTNLCATLNLCLDDPPRFAFTLARAQALADVFALDKLHPSVLAGLYLTGAMGYQQQGNTESALAMLTRYTDTVTGDIYPLKLKGDDFFNQIDPWLETLDLGTGLPRDECTIRRSMVASVSQNPAFAALADFPAYRALLARLKTLEPDPATEK